MKLKMRCELDGCNNRCNRIGRTIDKTNFLYEKYCCVNHARWAKSRRDGVVKRYCITCDEEFYPRSFLHVMCSDACRAKKLSNDGPGVYMIWIDSDPRVYVGKAKNVNARILNHKTQLLGNSKKHNTNKFLYYAYKASDGGPIGSRVLAVCNIKDAQWLEQVIRRFAPEGSLYNIA